MCREVARSLDCAVVEVEGNVVVPVQVAYPKEAFGARPLRLSINKVLHEYLKPMPPECVLHNPSAVEEGSRGVDIVEELGWKEDFDLLHTSVNRLLKRLDIDRRCDRSFPCVLFFA